MKNIILRIIGSQMHGGDPSEDGMEFITEGRFIRRGDAIYLVYEESELSGIEGCTTSLKITPDKVRMKRYGEEIGYENSIEFEKGKKWGGYYDTPFGPMPMEVLTNAIDNRLDPEGDGGSVDIDCSVCLKGLAEIRNILKFEIM